MGRFGVFFTVLVVAVVAGCGSSSGSAGSPSSDGGNYDYGAKANAFFDDFMNDESTISFAGQVDFAEVGDRELIAAGKEFCSALKSHDAASAAEVVASRFDGEVLTPIGDDDPEGAVELATRLGPFAVDHFCPSLRSALND